MFVGEDAAQIRFGASSSRKKLAFHIPSPGLSEGFGGQHRTNYCSAASETHRLAFTYVYRVPHATARSHLPIGCLEKAGRLYVLH